MYIDLSNARKIIRSQQATKIKSIETLKFYMRYGFELSSVRISVNPNAGTRLPFLEFDMQLIPTCTKLKNISKKAAIEALLKKFGASHVVTPVWLHEGLLTPEAKILKRLKAVEFEEKFTLLKQL